jgi:hypothetical protein
MVDGMQGRRVLVEGWDLAGGSGDYPGNASDHSDSHPDIALSSAYATKRDIRHAGLGGLGKYHVPSSARPEFGHFYSLSGGMHHDDVTSVKCYCWMYVSCYLVKEEGSTNFARS